MNTPKNADPRTMNLDSIEEYVTVREFRNRYDHLLRIVNCDFHSCVNHGELMRWAEIARRIGTELLKTGCKRATVRDWEWRQTAIDKSASLLSGIDAGTVTRKPVRPHLHIV